MLILLTILKLPYRGVRWLLLHAWYVIRAIFLGMAATPGIVFVRGPVGAYRKVARFRNWLLAKVEYLQSESAKWKTTFNILKSPYSLLRSFGLSPQLAVSFLVAGSAATGTVVAAEVMKEPSFAAGDAGVYSAPIDTPVMWSETFNTLRLDLGSVPVSSIIIEGVSIGDIYTGSSLPSGATTTIDIGGTDSVSTSLEVGVFTFERNRCDTLLLESISAHTLVLEENISDGQSISPGAGTARPRRILGGHHMADSMETTSGTYDRLLIQAPTASTNGKVDTLTIRNAFSRGGQCYLHDIKAGTFIVRQNVIGGDSSLVTKAFQVGTSVTASVIENTDNVEVAMALPATVTADS